MPNGLSETLAKRFLMKIDKYTEYNVNIIDVNGIIIAASRMKERIGKFHEMAYYMIQNHVESMVIQSENDYDGVLPGRQSAFAEQRKCFGRRRCDRRG